MKLETVTNFLSVAPQRREHTSSSAETTFSKILQNVNSTALPAQKFAGPMRLALQQSSLSSSQQTKPIQSLNERALGLRAYRQELLASNIANADTPGYKAVDIDINEALRSGKSKDDVPIQYRIPAQGSADNNTVDMDVERAHFAQNALMYEYTVDRVKGHYKEIEDLLKNTPY